MQLVTLIVSILALVVAILSFVFRKPGPQGPQGETGLRGIPGEDGHDGVNGLDGITPEFKVENGHLLVSYDDKATWDDLGQFAEKGEKGEKGDPGEMGPQGPQGPAGPRGHKGSPGKDAVVIDGSKELTATMIESAMTDEQGEIQFTKPVAAPSFHQKLD